MISMPLRWVLSLPSSSGIRPKALHTAAGANLGRQSSRVHRGGGGDTTTDVNSKQSGGVEDGHVSRHLSDAVTGDADEVASVTDHQTGMLTNTSFRLLLMHYDIVCKNSLW